MPVDASLPPVVAVVGTTASGKSDLGIRLALALGGEVISADSRQVYRGLDVGSGKVTAAERQQVPHHLLDVADVRDRFTAADFQRQALRAVQDIVGRGRVPLVVGGTGLYVRALLDNPTFPQAVDPALRAELESTPLSTLVDRLRTLDPAGAASIDLHNPRRVVRALEITLSSGVPFSQQRLIGEPRVCSLQLGLSWPRDELRRRIEERVDARLAGEPSMLDEVRRLLESGVPAERLLELGLEYRFLTRYLLGEVPYEAMVAQLKMAIWQFARRQLTWFRRDTRIHWLDVSRDPFAEALTLSQAFLNQTRQGTI